ncbi:MAG: hypothetical protein JXD22_10895, partial [Sedimentisphaerales bacterium]|nr:hypothetical protein [Sedimentisphaerales bacterium]
MNTSTWAEVGTTITYTYDANGSLISKTTCKDEQEETITYAYNLQNRLFKVTTNLESPPDTV